MTNLFSLLRRRRETRTTDAATSYWRALEKGSARDLSERAMTALLDEVEVHADALHKTTDDVEADLSLLRDLQDLAGADGGVERARAAQRDTMRECAAWDAEADQLVQRSDQLRVAARNARETAMITVREAEATHASFRDLTRKLAAAGRPAEVAAANAAAVAREIESLQGELRSIDAGLSHSSAPPFERRAAIAARLAELGAKP